MAYIPPFGAGDALCAQTLNDQKVFTDWLTANGQNNKGLVTEVSIPGSCQAGTDPNNSAIFDPQWDNVLQQWFEGANRANLHVTPWLASEWNIDLRVYRTDDATNKPLNYRTTVSSILENNLSGANGVTALRGVAYGGGDYATQGGNGIVNRSHLSQPGAGYYYPNPGSFVTLFARGIILSRIPVMWERLQPTLKGALDPAEMAALDLTINAAYNAGCKVILDMHNYGRYDATPLGNGGDTLYMLGQNAPATHNGATVGGTMSDCFADFWTKILNHYNGGQLWACELTNEPHDFPGGVSDWQNASRQAVEAIRLVNQTVKIAIDGYGYATIPNWTSTNGTSAWLTETIPAGQTGAGTSRNNDPNILWTGHHYFNAVNGRDGTFPNTYAQELSNAQNNGFAAYSTGGYTAPATNNTLQTGLRTVHVDSFDSNPGTYSPYVSQSNPGNPNGLAVGSNTITMPFSGVGNPGNSMKIVCTATSDEGSLRQSLTGNLNSRELYFDFMLDSSTPVSSTADFCIDHLWSNGNANDLAEIRIIGVTGQPGMYNVKVNTTGTGYPSVTGTTNFANGAFNTFHFQVTDTAFKLYMNGNASPEVTFAGSFAGQNIGGSALGKFYGNQALTMYFDNFKAGIVTSYWAPPNGGQMTSAAVVTPTSSKGLIGFI